MKTSHIIIGSAVVTVAAFFWLARRAAAAKSDGNPFRIVGSVATVGGLAPSKPTLAELFTSAPVATLSPTTNPVSPPPPSPRQQVLAGTLATAITRV